MAALEVVVLAVCRVEVRFAVGVLVEVVEVAVLLGVVLMVLNEVVAGVVEGKKLGATGLKRKGVRPWR